MGWRNQFQEIANSKPLFLTIYATVIIGILFSSFYVFSAVYSSSSSPSWFPQVSSHVESPPRDQLPNSSQLTTVGVVLSPAPQSQNKLRKPIWEVPPSGSKMPPLKTFRLTKGLVQKRVKDNIIIMTFGNYAFMDFILTWVKHLTDLGLDNILVGAMDTKLLEALYWKGIPVFDMGSHMSTTDVGWGSATFHKMGREKVVLIDTILPFGFELLMCDTDMVWLKLTFFAPSAILLEQNPLPYLARFPEADVLTSSDQVSPTVADDRLDIWKEGIRDSMHGSKPVEMENWVEMLGPVGAAYNIGIFHWRPSDATKKLANEWKDMLLADDKIWDQNGFNELVRRQLGPSVDEDSELAYAYDGKLKLGVLPASIFCSGHTYFVQSNGTEGKRHRLREAMIFYDPPEYYDSPGMKQIRTALSIASLLNRTLEPKQSVSHPRCSRHLKGYQVFIPSNWGFGRGRNLNFNSLFQVAAFKFKAAFHACSLVIFHYTLPCTMVMPPLWCRLDRLWFPHPGVLIGTMTRQPFLCPLDHVFEVNVMLKEMPADEFGPGINLREYSFFDNPSVPRQVKESWLDVQLCQEGSQNCNVSNSTSPTGVLKFPKNGNEETTSPLIKNSSCLVIALSAVVWNYGLYFKTVFSSFKDVKVIQFSSMQDAFLGFTDKTREEKFRNRVKRYVGIWCCVQNHTPGHIYYDMYWDEKPDWKPIPPQKPEDDHPPW
ncbi:unnamed protein product [Camellia sinensis]